MADPLSEQDVERIATAVGRKILKYVGIALVIWFGLLYILGALR